MSKFLHKLAEGLRSREKLLEDHSEHSAFEGDNGVTLRAEYEELLDEVRAFSARIEQAEADGREVDEHFEREIGDEHNRISVKIDAWASKLPGN